MEIKFRFSCGSKDKKVKVSEGQNIWEVVNYFNFQRFASCKYKYIFALMQW